MNSSISNSELLRQGERAGRSRRVKRKWSKIRSFSGIFGLIVLLILSEMFVFRNLNVYGLHSGFIGQIAEIKASFEAIDPEEIEVAIFGDSLGMDALRPDILADVAGMDPEKIFNFSLSGGSAYDSAAMYETYGAQMPNLDTVIIIVNEHQFNNAEADKDIKFKYFAGLKDRVKVMNADNYGELLLGWLLKSYDMRTVWTMLLEKYRLGELREEVPVYEGGLPPVTWSPKEDREPSYALEVATRWFSDYKIDGVRTEAFEAMLSSMRRRGVRVILLQLPRSSYFESVAQSKYGSAQKMYLQRMEELANIYGAQWSVLPKELLQFPEHFRDVNHVNPDGAKIVSEYVARHWLTL